MTPICKKHTWRRPQLYSPYGTETQPSHMQSHKQKLASFASLSAISGTFNSLSKVLFIFPSRYLFAIGLGTVFSFRGQLPPILHTMSKVRDSKITLRMHNLSTWTGLSPYLALYSKETYAGGCTGKGSQDYNAQASLSFTSWALPGSVALTKGIIFIFFSSAYLYA